MLLFLFSIYLSGEEKILTSVSYLPLLCSENHPSGAFDGEYFLVVWDERNGKIRGVRIDSYGNPADTIITIVRGKHPFLIFDGESYFLVWQRKEDECTHIYGARLSREGKIIDSIIPVCILYESAYPKVAYGNGKYLIVWEDFRHENPDIYGAILDKESNIIEEIPICVEGHTQYSPFVSFGKNEFMVGVGGFSQ